MVFTSSITQLSTDKGLFCKNLSIFIKKTKLKILQIFLHESLCVLYGNIYNK